ncbi:MAG: ABC transporter permease [Planctomycetes bacterium]|jgi:oligopeptide transport system permease protein|nr:ABC transporter permease [Planctomycetota bacterium]MDA8378754.1 ABC transporter permease [Planctomycetia bacterium]
MKKFILSRLLQSIVVVWLVYTVTFWLLMATPGDPFIGKKQPPPAVLAALRQEYHLNKGDFHAYLAYGWQVLAHGNFGPTISYANWTVLDVIRNSLPVSVALGSMALLIALWLGVGAGVLGAVFRGRWPDMALTVGTLLGISLPTFVIGSGLLMLLAVETSLLPSGGWGTLRQLILPAFTLAVPFLAYISRLSRASTLDVISADFVRTARAKGLSPMKVIAGHVLPNASIAVLSYLGPATASVLTGSFVVEKIFAIPGLGEVFVNACLDKDIPLVLGIVLVYTVILVLMNLLVDIASAMADPRIRL